METCHSEATNSDGEPFQAENVSWGILGYPLSMDIWKSMDILEGTAGGAADSAAEGEPETEKEGEQKTADDGRMEFIRLLKQVPCG